MSMSTPASSNDSASSTVASSTASTSSNPFTALSQLDSSKKYTLVFLLSVGTTLLVTGASGGRLLKRAKKMTAEPVIPASLKPSTSTRTASIQSDLPLIPPSSTHHRFRLSATSSSTSAHNQRPSASLLELATAFPPLETQHRSLLRQWSKDKGSDLSFWLPNSSLLNDSIRAAAQSEVYDKAGIGYDETEKENEQEYIDDGFNPATYAAKAFAIASVITIGTFAAAIGGVMRWYGVSDLESLSLALSHSLPTVFESHRPEIPAWALPSPKAIQKPGEEEDNDEHKEGVAYWFEVKETLDREAAEREIERRTKWERLKASRV